MTTDCPSVEGFGALVMVRQRAERWLRQAGLRDTAAELTDVRHTPAARTRIGQTNGDTRDRRGMLSSPASAGVW
jgi:hypothetical protein